MGSPTSTNQNAYIGQLGTLAGETAGQATALGQYAAGAGAQETNAFLNAINSITSTDPTVRFAAIAPEVQDINSQFNQAQQEIAANVPRGGESNYLQALNEMQRASNISNMENQEFSQALQEQGQFGQQLMSQGYQGFGVGQSGAATGGELTSASAQGTAAGKASNFQNISSALTDIYSGTQAASGIEKLLGNTAAPAVATAAGSAAPAAAGAISALSGAPATLPLDTSLAGEISSVVPDVTGATTASGAAGAGAATSGGILSGIEGAVAAPYTAISGAVTGALGGGSLAGILGTIAGVAPYLAPLALIPLLFHGADPNEQTAATAHQAFNVAGEDIVNAAKSGYITPDEAKTIMNAMIPSAQQQVGGVVSGLNDKNSKVQGTVTQLTNELNQNLAALNNLPQSNSTVPFSTGGLQSSFINPSTPGYMSSAVSQGNQLAMQAIENLMSSAYAQAA